MAVRTNLDNDIAHNETDEIIDDLSARIIATYEQASNDALKKYEDYISKFKVQEAANRAKVRSGDMTPQEYVEWHNKKVFVGRYYEKMKNAMAEDYAKADIYAQEIINGSLNDVFARNVNYSMYQIEKSSNISTSFTLYDADTVENLLKNEPELLPPLLPDSKTAKDIREGKVKKWNKGQINNAITRGIMGGDSMQDIAKRLKDVGVTDSKQAIRTARTAVTGAECAGRKHGYERAAAMGIDIKQMWLATYDGRTRHEHRQLDGQIRAVNEPFEVDGYKLDFPADPKGEPFLVYNCRCTTIPYLPEMAKSVGIDARYNEETGLSYEEWKDAKKPKPKEEPVEKEKPVEQKTTEYINGNNIIKDWARRNNEFDFAIEDAINAQGFDGLPTVLYGKDFEDAVKESNFIAQRTYSASNEEILQAYQEQLYSGKWYVDCSEGGAQYGQGMYCAADYTGKLTAGIKTEMKHYQMLNAYKGNIFAKTETITLVPNAKVITYNELIKKKEEAKRENAHEIITTLKEKFEKDKVPLKYQNAIYQYVAFSSDDYYLTLPLEQQNYAMDLWDEINKQYEAYDDAGVFAALLGYDAINAEGHGKSGSYTVILNRTAVILKGD